MIVYVTIGNSDNKLNQSDWAAFQEVVRYWCRHQSTQVFGVWYSLPDSRYQNMCTGFEIPETRIPRLKEMLEQARKDFKQDSISWAEATVTFIGLEKQ